MPANIIAGAEPGGRVFGPPINGAPTPMASSGGFGNRINHGFPGATGYGPSRVTTSNGGGAINEQTGTGSSEGSPLLEPQQMSSPAGGGGSTVTQPQISTSTTTSTTSPPPQVSLPEGNESKAMTARQRLEANYSGRSYDLAYWEQLHALTGWSPPAGNVPTDASNNPAAAPGPTRGGSSNNNGTLNRNPPPKPGERTGLSGFLFGQPNPNTRDGGTVLHGLFGLTRWVPWLGKKAQGIAGGAGTMFLSRNTPENLVNVIKETIQPEDLTEFFRNAAMLAAVPYTGGASLIPHLAGHAEHLNTHGEVEPPKNWEWALVHSESASENVLGWESRVFTGLTRGLTTYMHVRSLASAGTPGTPSTTQYIWDPKTKTWIKIVTPGTPGQEGAINWMTVAIAAVPLAVITAWNIKNPRKNDEMNESTAGQLGYDVARTAKIIQATKTSVSAPVSG